MEELQRLATLQEVYRMLKRALGPDESEGSYLPLAEALISKHAEIVPLHHFGDAEAENREQFCRLANDAEPDETEDDWALSRTHCNELYSYLLRSRRFKIGEAIKFGVEVSLRRERAAQEALLAAAQAKVTQDAATKSSSVVRLTPEDRYSMLLLAQQTSTDTDLAAMVKVADDYVEAGGEVELKEDEPAFLRGKIHRHTLNYRQPRAQQRYDPLSQLNRRGGLIEKQLEADKRTTLERIADKQGDVSKQRKALRKELEGAAGPSGARGGGDVEVRTQPILGLELGETTEEAGGGIRGEKDLPARLPPWMKPGPGGKVSFGPKSSLAMQEFRKRLPIAEHKEKILKHVAENPVTILVGEPGSGKTTQLTQYMVEGGYHKKGLIGCTQPRRVAATSVAERVAQEFGCKLGEEVGFSIRWKDCTSRLTLIRYMTDGVLLREALLDEVFSRYSVIILDEAHERGINTDVLFGMMKRALSRRPDLKVIVTSATLEIDKFCAFFQSPDPVMIRGTCHDVQIVYNEPTDDYVDAAVNLVMRIHTTAGPGDILVFLTGEAEIDSAAQRLFRMTQEIPDLPELLILPIYSALPNEVQSKVFEKTPELSRKVVIATNIAETSITIDNLYFVIDSGFTKMKKYNPRTGVEQLKVFPISQSQARQRAGRAGRTGPGVCYRLYTQEQFNEMAPSTEPEIRRSNLINVVLTLKAVGVGDILQFDFMDPPSQDSLVEALEKLYYLEALDDNGLLTTFGRRMSALPVDPTLSRTLLTAVDMGCIYPVTTCVAMVMAPHVFYRPRDKQQEADVKRSRFTHPDGDHLTLVAAFNAWQETGENEEWAKENFLNAKAMKDAKETTSQLLNLLNCPPPPVRAPGAPSVNDISDTTKIRKALTAGYFFQAAKRMNDGRYITMSDRREVAIHPSSCLFDVKPKYVVYHELVKTTRDFMREVMAINPSWLVEFAPHYYSVPQHGKLTKEQMAERIDPTLRRWETGNDWRISKLRRRRN